MKTTVDISDGLLEAAKATAAERGVTLRALIEEGLERLVAGDAGDSAFVLRDVSVEGDGAEKWHQLSNDDRTAAMYR